MASIWYLNHYGGGPGLSAFHRAYELSRAWRDMGHDATVFMASNHHLLKAPVDTAFEMDGVSYRPVQCRPYQGNGIGRLLNMADFVLNFDRATAGVRRPDVVIASSPHPFTIWSAYRHARRHRAKLIFEVRDLWPLSIIEILSKSRFHPFVLACEIAERFAFQKSDGIVSVLPRLDRYLALKGYRQKPFLWAPNGYVIYDAGGSPMSSAAEKALEVVREWHASGRLVIAHAGSIGKPNAIDLLIGAKLAARNKGLEKSFAILLIGTGHDAATLRSFVDQQHIEGVHFAGQLSKGEVGQLLNAVDVGYGGVRPHDTLYKFGVSLNKFSDYARSALPVILPLEPCGDPVSESGGGLARRAATADAVWEMIDEFSRISRAERNAMGMKFQSFLNDFYTYSVVASKYIDFIERVIRS